MNLKELVRILEQMPPDAPVKFQTGVGVCGMGSWRGDYKDLTLYHCDDRQPEPWTVTELLNEARAALAGKVYNGYKGGEFVMRADTAVWADDWGDSNCIAVMGITFDGSVKLATADISEYRW